jgi:hypothetical protein
MVIIEDIKSFSKKFHNKIGDYRRVDSYKHEKFPLENQGLQTITLKEAILLVNKLDTDICCGCGCKMLFCNYSPYCVYQFSFDRIDNKKIHSNDNLRIVCWNCNSSGHGSIKETCSRGCHKKLDEEQKNPVITNLMSHKANSFRTEHKVLCEKKQKNSEFLHVNEQVLYDKKVCEEMVNLYIIKVGNIKAQFLDIKRFKSVVEMLIDSKTSFGVDYEKISKSHNVYHALYMQENLSLPEGTKLKINRVFDEDD